jgi:hypothetical protein
MSLPPVSEKGVTSPGFDLRGSDSRRYAAALVNDK